MGIEKNGTVTYKLVWPLLVLGREPFCEFPKAVVFVRVWFEQVSGRIKHFGSWEQA